MAKNVPGTGKGPWRGRRVGKRRCVRDQPRVSVRGQGLARRLEEAGSGHAGHRFSHEEQAQCTWMKLMPSLGFKAQCRPRIIPMALELELLVPVPSTVLSGVPRAESCARLSGSPPTARAPWMTLGRSERVGLGRARSREPGSPTRAGEARVPWSSGQGATGGPGVPRAHAPSAEPDKALGSPEAPSLCSVIKS